MTLKVMPQALSVCKVGDVSEIDLFRPLYFIGRTENELSLVCETSCVPLHALEREDGWRALRIEGTLDFSLMGILSKLTGLLAAAGICIFAMSTFDTDYILVKCEDLEGAVRALSEGGYAVV